MRASFKYRIYPTKPQTQFLDGELREAASLYNAAKQERDSAWNTCRKSINYYDQANQLKAMRADGCLTLSNFSCCQDVLRRVDKTYKAFFRRVKAGEKPGFPRYRSFRRYDSLTFPSYGDGCRRLDNGKLRLQDVRDVPDIRLPAYTFMLLHVSTFTSLKVGAGLARIQDSCPDTPAMRLWPAPTASFPWPVLSI